MSVPMKSQSVKDSHAAFLPEGLYFAMDILTGHLESFFPNVQPFQGPLLLLCLAWLLLFFLPFVCFPHAFGQRGSHHLLVLGLSSTDYFHFTAAFHVHLLYTSCLTYTHKHISAVSHKVTHLMQSSKLHNSHKEMNVLHWRQI